MSRKCTTFVLLLGLCLSPTVSPALAQADDDRVGLIISKPPSATSKDGADKRMLRRHQQERRRCQRP